MKRLLIAAAAAALLITGCSPLTEVIARDRAVAVCGHPDGVVLIVGAHRDAPAPASLDPRVACLVGAAVKDGKPVILIDASGQPSVLTPRLMSVDGGTLAQQDSPRVAQDVQRVNEAVAGLRPQSPGVDDLAALAVAADAAQSAGLPRADLVVLDSGLNDRGALDFTVPGMVAAALLALTVSFDDYVTTSMVAGVDSETLPMVIYAMARRGASPVINAISALITVVFGILIVVSQWVREK